MKAQKIYIAAFFFSPFYFIFFFVLNLCFFAFLLAEKFSDDKKRICIMTHLWIKISLNESRLFKFFYIIILCMGDCLTLFISLEEKLYRWKFLQVVFVVVATLCVTLCLNDEIIKFIWNYQEICKFYFFSKKCFIVFTMRVCV